MKRIKLGLIGSSEGNGHPYSWSAICNGYNSDFMENCPFPAIPEYLSKQSFPRDQIKGGLVTHIWTQDESESRKIALATNIKNVTTDLDVLIGNVDAVLLARDDANNHSKYAFPVLEAGLPIYIDKPLAFSRADALSLLSKQEYEGQIFSCSATRYSRDFCIDNERLREIGDTLAIYGQVPKSWERYAIHALEPALRLLEGKGKLNQYQVWQFFDRTTLSVGYENGVELRVTAFEGSLVPISLIIEGILQLTFSDPFFAFKRAIEEFMGGIQAGSGKISSAEMLEVVSLIELGCKN